MRIIFRKIWWTFFEQDYVATVRRTITANQSCLCLLLITMIVPTEINSPSHPVSYSPNNGVEIVNSFGQSSTVPWELCSIGKFTQLMDPLFRDSPAEGYTQRNRYVVYFLDFQFQPRVSHSWAELVHPGNILYLAIKLKKYQFRKQRCVRCNWYITELSGGCFVNCPGCSAETDCETEKGPLLNICEDEQSLGVKSYGPPPKPVSKSKGTRSPLADYRNFQNFYVLL
ncbi:unnamed protein product [Cyclocybe aegerita]|uniref:Uncharacterized protein n=1 Tax=Cyclocybe aegerita TaxID=1973307 RepID=A0A8S0W7V7_CYCAE|nr:unnamed protein product [Cyclocybe aegerita]